MMHVALPAFLCSYLLAHLSISSPPIGAWSCSRVSPFIKLWNYFYATFSDFRAITSVTIAVICMTTFPWEDANTMFWLLTCREITDGVAFVL